MAWAERADDGGGEEGCCWRGQEKEAAGSWVSSFKTRACWRGSKTVVEERVCKRVRARLADKGTKLYRQAHRWCFPNR